MQECLLNLMPLCLAQTCYSTGSVSPHCGGRVARALQSWGSFMIARSLSYPGLGGVGAGANSCSCSWKAELRANDPRTKLTPVSMRVCTPKPGASDPVFSTTSPTFSPWPEDPLYQNPAGASGTGCPTLGGKWKSPEVSQAGTKNSDPTLKLVCHIKIT